MMDRIVFVQREFLLQKKNGWLPSSPPVGWMEGGPWMEHRGGRAGLSYAYSRGTKKAKRSNICEKASLCCILSFIDLLKGTLQPPFFS